MNTIKNLFMMAALSFVSGKSISQNIEVMIVKNLTDIKWHPKESLPAGAESAVVSGDPSTGSYSFYGKFPRSYTVPLHWHSNACSVEILMGSMIIKRPGLSDVTINAGGFFTLPAGMKYVAFTPERCIFHVHGSEPFDIIYNNPKDDPRK